MYVCIYVCMYVCMYVSMYLIMTFFSICLTLFLLIFFFRSESTNKIQLVFPGSQYHMQIKILFKLVIINSTKTENKNDAARHFVEFIRNILRLQNLIDEQLRQSLIVSNIYPSSMPFKL